VSTWSLAKNEFSLKTPSICSGVFNSSGFPGLPFSQDHVEKLVNDLGFPDRFFVDLIAERRLSTRITTRTADCWTMRDWLFSAVTLQRTRNNDILGIIVIGNQYKHNNIEAVLKRYVSSKTYYRHPLYPILLIADAALEDYRDIIELAVFQSQTTMRLSDVIFQQGLRVNQKDLTTELADTTGRRERLTHLLGMMKAFQASVRNLLNLHDGSDAPSGDPGLLQSPSTQAGGQVVSIPPLTSMLQCIISASGDILERITVADTVLQNSFLVVRIPD
jgi:hypothetical protein